MQGPDYVLTMFCDSWYDRVFDVGILDARGGRCRRTAVTDFLQPVRYVV